MLVRLVLLFTLLPLVELAVLLWIAERTSWWFTVGLVIFTGVLGAALARHQGLRCWRQFRLRLAQGEVPAAELLDGLMILLAAAVLVTPGVITDCLGFLLLVPPLRRQVRRRLAERLRATMIFRGYPGPAGAGCEDKDVIDVQSRPPGESSSKEG